MSIHAPRRRNALVFIALLSAGALGLTGCATAEQSGATASASGVTAAKTAGLSVSLYKKAVAEAKSAAGGKKLGGTLDYIGGQSGSQAQTLQAAYRAFTDATGTKITYTQSGSSVSTTAAIQSRIAAGNPPDLVDLSLGQAKAFAKQGYTLDLTKTIGSSTLADNYAPSLLTSLSYKGKVFGVTQGFSNFMVWYNPKTYTGPTSPSSWKEVTDWTDSAAAKGSSPWCIAEEAGGGSGFPGTQFIETLFAKTYGPQAVSDWADGTLSWTSDKVKGAWQEFGKIALDDSKVAGGVTGSLSTNIATGSNGLISSPAGCQTDLWGSWVPGVIGKGVEPGTNLSFFQVPGVVSKYASTEIYNAGATVVLKSTAASRAFIKFLASSQAQALIGSADIWTVANKKVSSSAYSSPLLKKAAGIYFGNSVSLVAPPDIMASSAVDAAFNKGVMSYLADPSTLDDVLATIEAASKS
jgi:alpha-glucoside transport system substrate-binding protein